MTAKIKKLWKNEYIQTATIVGIIILIFFSIWFGATIALNNPNPIVVVPTGSMCIPYDGACDGWNHPFDRTLHVGDLLILQGLDPKDYNTNYPNSDIIVFHESRNPDNLIVHRIVAAEEKDGILYFHTKGDGNTYIKWPNPVTQDQYDPPSIEPPEGVSQDKVVGRVVMRIPWAGNVVLKMRTPEGIAVVVVLVVLLVLLEFVLPIFRKKSVQSVAVKSTDSNL